MPVLPVVPSPAALIEKALEKLAAEGSGERIAVFLRKRRGWGGHGMHTCPIARYLSQETRLSVAVHGSTWSTLDIADRPLPAPVAEFIKGFDGHLEGYGSLCHHDLGPQFRLIGESW